LRYRGFDQAEIEDGRGDGGRADGGAGGLPRILSSTQAPRSTGDVRVPSAVTFKTLACVITPPRCEPGGSVVRRSSLPCNPGTRYNVPRRSFNIDQSESTNSSKLASRRMLVVPVGATIASFGIAVYLT